MRKLLFVTLLLILFSSTIFAQKKVTVDLDVNAYFYTAQSTVRNCITRELELLDGIVISNDPLFLIEVSVLRAGIDDGIKHISGRRSGLVRPTTNESKDDDYILSVAVSRRNDCYNSSTKKREPCYVSGSQILISAPNGNLNKMCKAIVNN